MISNRFWTFSLFVFEKFTQLWTGLSKFSGNFFFQCSNGIYILPLVFRRSVTHSYCVFLSCNCILQLVDFGILFYRVFVAHHWCSFIFPAPPFSVSNFLSVPKPQLLAMQFFYLKLCFFGWPPQFHPWWCWGYLTELKIRFSGVSVSAPACHPCLWTFEAFFLSIDCLFSNKTVFFGSASFLEIYQIWDFDLVRFCEK